LLFGTELIAITWIELVDQMGNTITTQLAVSVIVDPHNFGGLFYKMFVGK
jgi:hypothetical protein